jgi:dihydrofolate reductase
VVADPDGTIESVHIAGGGSVYTEAMESLLADVLLVTEVEREDGAVIRTDAQMLWPLPGNSPYAMVMQGPQMRQNGFLFRFTAWARRLHARDVLVAPRVPAPGFWYGSLV